MSRALPLGLVLSAMLVAACGVSRPSRVERSAINFVKHRIAVGGARRTNPFPATPENLRDGRQAFSHYCITCHGLDGQGTGVPFAEQMSPPVPSLASPDVQSYTDGQLKWVIENGQAFRSGPISRSRRSTMCATPSASLLPARGAHSRGA